VLTAGGVDFEPVDGGALARIANEENAAEALAWLVGQGVKIHRFGIAGSALEQTYMAMNEERR